MRHQIQKSIIDKLAKNHACYVLITCGEPSADGNMHVEMSYQGDATLAAYLIQGAQSFMDERQDDIESDTKCEKIQIIE
jgi:hypothetical protein